MRRLRPITSRRRAQRVAAAFTLLELVLVLVLISTALAMAAPSMTGWGRGSRLRDAGDQLLAVARWGRAQAIANSQVYRLSVDAQNGRYWLSVMEGQQFVTLGTDFGRVFTMPEGFRVALTDERSQPLQTIDFQPTGRSTPVRMRIATPQGDVIDIICPSPAEDFRLATAQEQQALR